MTVEAIDTDAGVEEFVDAATTAGATVHRTSPGGLPDVVDDLLVTPAVGTELEGELELPDGVATGASGADIEAAATGVTGAPIGIVQYGTVVIAPEVGREGQVSLFPSRQIAIVRESNLVPDVGTALAEIAERFDGDVDDAILVTGPSSTGDMGALVTGVHGPGELHVVLVED